jgi:Tfp pilus assembly PilM family ATPase
MELTFWRKKKNWDKPFSEKVAKRVAKIATPDLTSWIEQAMSETSRSLNSYQKQQDAVNLEDLVLGAEAIHALISELQKRTML